MNDTARAGADLCQSGAYGGRQVSRRTLELTVGKPHTPWPPEATAGNSHAPWPPEATVVKPHTPWPPHSTVADHSRDRHVPMANSIDSRRTDLEKETLPGQELHYMDCSIAV